MWRWIMLDPYSDEIKLPSHLWKLESTHMIIAGPGLSHVHKPSWRWSIPTLRSACSVVDDVIKGSQLWILSNPPTAPHAAANTVFVFSSERIHSGDSPDYFFSLFLVGGEHYHISQPWDPQLNFSIRRKPYLGPCRTQSSTHEYRPKDLGATELRDSLNESDLIILFLLWILSAKISFAL